MHLLQQIRNNLNLQHHVLRLGDGERLPAALTQGLRDFFGAHTYGRIDADRDKRFHTLWSGDLSEVEA